MIERTFFCSSVSIGGFEELSECLIWDLGDLSGDSDIGDFDFHEMWGST